MEKNNGQNALARQKEKLQSLLSEETFQKSLKDVIPKHLTPNRIVKMALVAASRQPKLYKCTEQSFLQSIMKSGELGLDCVGTLGQGYLVPYWSTKVGAYECQFIPGYQGFVTLARRSKLVSDIDAQLVYEKDFFDVEFGTNRFLKHKPYLNGDRGEIVQIYAIAYFPDGISKFDVMSKKDVDAIKDRSKSRNKDGELVGPWVTDYGEMARKTPVRRLAKYLPLSPEMPLAKAFEADNQQFDFNAHNEVAKTVQAGVEGLKERLTKEVKSTEVVPEEVDDPETKAKAQEQIKKLKDAPAKPEPEAEQPDKTEAKPDIPFICLDCKHKFEGIADEKNICPSCFSKNIEAQTAETDSLYVCLKCLERFDIPKKGKNGVTLCPKCLSQDIDAVEDVKKTA